MLNGKTGLRVAVFHTEDNVLSSVCFLRGDLEVISRSSGMLWPGLVLKSGNISIYLLKRQNSCHSQRTPGSGHLEILEFICGLQSAQSVHSLLSLPQETGHRSPNGEQICHERKTTHEYETLPCQ